MDAGTIATIVIGLVAAWAALLVILWLVRPRNVALRELVGVVPDVLRLVRDLLADPSVPRGVRLALAGLLIWLVSPIDLVPEFIPALGPLDDVIVAVLVLRYVRRRLGSAALRARWRGSAPGFTLLERLIGSG